MKKLSVNGKDFDEVFAEKGNPILIQNMIEGNVYFWHDFDCPHLSSIIKFSDYHRSEIFVKSGLFDNGQVIRKTSYMFESYDIFFEATPNQIYLLNAYKSVKP